VRFELAKFMLESLVFLELFDFELTSLFVLALDSLDSFLELFDDFLSFVLFFLFDILGSFEFFFILGPESTMQAFDHFSLLEGFVSFGFALTEGGLGLLDSSVDLGGALVILGELFQEFVGFFET